MRILLAALFLIIPLSAKAADFRVVEGKDRTHIFMTGTIAKGDFDKFYELIRNKKVRRKTTLYLNSIGGNMTQAMRIGAWVWRDGVRTFITANSKCLSACHLIFIAGYDKEHKRRDRWKHVNGKLGAHSPTYKSKNQTVVKLWSGALENYLKTHEAGNGVHEMIKKTPQRDMYYFSNAELKKFGGYRIFGGSAKAVLYDALDPKYWPAQPGEQYIWKDLHVWKKETP